MPMEEAPVYVVLDSNQWRSQYGLRSRVGAALLFLLRQHGGKLGLPEVVESEIVPLLVSEGNKAVRQVVEQFRVLQAITGSHPSVKLPENDELANSVAARLDELSALIMRVPISEDHSRRALARVNERRSPNRKREQFKDSLIWEAVHDLGAVSRVHFVTEDGAFFGSDGRSMAEDLLEECSEFQLRISLYRGLRELLPVLQGAAPELAYGAIADQLLHQLGEYLSEVAARDDFLMEALDDSSIQAFATEDHNRLVLTYELSGSLKDDPSVVSEHDRKGRFVVAGEGTLDLNTHQVVEAKPGRCRVYYVDETGEEESSQNVVMGAATAYIGGEPPKRLQIREPIGEGQ